MLRNDYAVCNSELGDLSDYSCESTGQSFAYPARCGGWPQTKCSHLVALRPQALCRDFAMNSVALSRYQVYANRAEKLNERFTECLFFVLSA